MGKYGKKKFSGSLSRKPACRLLLPGVDIYAPNTCTHAFILHSSLCTPLRLRLPLPFCFTIPMYRAYNSALALLLALALTALNEAE